MRKALMVLLAVGLLGAIAPVATAFEPGQPAAVADCCGTAAASCDGVGLACAVEQVCQQASTLARKEAQTPLFSPVIVEAGWRERILPPPESAAAPPAPLALGGSPAYLRFHRFLL